MKVRVPESADLCSKAGPRQDVAIPLRVQASKPASCDVLRARAGVLHSKNVTGLAVPRTMGDLRGLIQYKLQPRRMEEVSVFAFV